MGTDHNLTQVEQPLQQSCIRRCQAELFCQQRERVALAVQALPDDGRAGGHLALQLVEDAELAQLVATVEDLVEALFRPLSAAGVAAEPIADGLQLAREAPFAG